jgi:hypothetical protein
MSAVDAYIANLPEQQQRIVQQPRELILSHQEISECLRWNVPVYSLQGSKVYLFGFQAFRTHLNLNFFFGAQLDDPGRLLNGTGSRVRHVTLHSVADIDLRSTRALLYQSIVNEKARMRHMRQRATRVPQDGSDTATRVG